MPTIIDPATLPESVKALVSTGRYLKHRLEASLALLRKQQSSAYRATASVEVVWQDTHDLIALLEDFQQRFSLLEHQTYPEEYAKNRRPDGTILPSTKAQVETSASQASIGTLPEESALESPGGGQM